MDQIIKSDCIEVGYIQKPHGLKGEVIVVFEAEYSETFEEIEILLIDIDGGLVPFFIEDHELRFRNDESVICKFMFVDSLSKAKELVGCKVYVSDEDLVSREGSGIESALIGMTVFDTKFGEVGKIGRVDDFSGNLVITVNHLKAEIMIPLSDEFILSLDEESRELHLNCPNGLIDIYLE